MVMEVYASLPGAEYLYDKDTDIALLVFLNYNTSEDFRRNTEFLVKSIEERHLSKLIIDTESLKIIGKEDQIWSNTEMVPRMLNAGVRLMAIVNSLYYFTRLGAASILETFDKERTAIEYFNNRDDALSWLKSRTV
eukprot:TRINITY_DN3665_c0_g3_i2.p1 TRINITY_DN3665_c0_g3~~TRINITY_DN3665_c0_g3_i2.p1  ORF type:complete len:136 (-),score=32.23 TRINITY_DN3665_c0_g3_i2:33-440(-)